MKLTDSPASPFVRKVKVLSMETGLDSRIELVSLAVADLPPELLAMNPIGKIPALITDDGLRLDDSPLICEYLDSLHDGPKMIPESGAERWRVLNVEAIVDGFLDAAVARRGEMSRPDGERSPPNIEKLRLRMERCLDDLEAIVDSLGDTFDLAQICTGVACGYADFRWAAEPWRSNRPKLTAWYESFAQRPSMQATVPEEYS